MNACIFLIKVSIPVFEKLILVHLLFLITSVLIPGRSTGNLAKLPVDLPGIKTEVIKNNKWTKINFSKTGIETLIKKIQAFTGNKNPKHMNENEFYKDIF